MFLLLLMSLGTAGVKAQVRIGGNTAPNASAVLDLNANDTSNGTQGLALPRVGLTSNTMLLPGVATNLTGMLVYNTSTTGGAGVNTIGLYFWNGATWVKASLPSITPADSGKILMVSKAGNVTLVATPNPFAHSESGQIVRHPGTVVPTLYKVIDTIINATFVPGTYTAIPCPACNGRELCALSGGSALKSIYMTYGQIFLFVFGGNWTGPYADLTQIVCYAGSI